MTIIYCYNAQFSDDEIVYCAEIDFYCNYLLQLSIVCANISSETKKNTTQASSNAPDEPSAGRDREK